MMNDKLTRRKFIQTTISAGSALVFCPGLPLAPIVTTRCYNCGIHEEELASSASFRLHNKQFCPNCGIDLYSNRYPITKNCDCSSAASGKIKKKKEGYPPCCQVPFPEIAQAGSITKPILNITDLKF